MDKNKSIEQNLLDLQHRYLICGLFALIVTLILFSAALVLPDGIVYAFLGFCSFIVLVVFIRGHRAVKRYYESYTNNEL